MSSATAFIRIYYVLFASSDYTSISKIQMQLGLLTEISTCRNWILEHLCELRNNTEVHK